MQKQIKEYYALLKRFVNLQQKLIQAVETKVEVFPLPPDFPNETRSKLEKVIIHGYSISQVLQTWPIDIGIVPLLAWIKPTRGIVQLDGQSWLFDFHGSRQVSFVDLPSKLDLQQRFQEHGIDALRGLRGNLNVEVQYLEGGRTDAINAWSVWLFAQSVDLWMSNLSQSNHNHFLEDMVKEGLLTPWPHLHVGEDQYFVFATENETATSWQT